MKNRVKKVFFHFWTIPLAYIFDDPSKWSEPWAFVLRNFEKSSNKTNIFQKLKSFSTLYKNTFFHLMKKYIAIIKKLKNIKESTIYLPEETEDFFVEVEHHENTIFPNHLESLDQFLNLVGLLLVD